MTLPSLLLYSVPFDLRRGHSRWGQAPSLHFAMKRCPRKNYFSAILRYEATTATLPERSVRRLCCFRGYTTWQMFVNPKTPLFRQIGKNVHAGAAVHSYLSHIAPAALPVLRRDGADGWLCHPSAPSLLNTTEVYMHLYGSGEAARISAGEGKDEGPLFVSGARVTWRGDQRGSQGRQP